MRAVLRWSAVLAPIVVVFGLGEFHAHFIGHYPFTGTSRFAWMIGYIAVLEIASYGVGIPDTPSTDSGALWSASAAVVTAGLGVSIVQLLSASAILPRAVVFGSGLVLIPAYSVLTILDLRARQDGSGAERVVAVLNGDDSAALSSDIHRFPEHVARLVALVDPDRFTPRLEDSVGQEMPTLPNLVELAMSRQATVVVLGREAQINDEVLTGVATLHRSGVKVRTLSLFYDEWLGKLPVSELERISLMFDIQELHTPSYARLKRIVDLATALVGLVALVVFSPVVWTLDRLGNKGPLFFRQVRVGKGGKTFTIIKFRTMAAGGDEEEWTDENDPRLGRIGRWLRRTHLDELPQAINIARGEISLVGPRPEQPRYVEELREKIRFYDVRHLVKPGVTGWAQVKFPYGSSVSDALEKLQYEFYYLRHQGPLLDAKIIARTLRSVVRMQGR
ncbi:MAG: sugar transferase [Actinobacteria bacterium]|nr:sugar transferase [Actinomycetota bacterium]MCL5445319.1 sugar transferase [Actinomycetota bacterium]